MSGPQSQREASFGYPRSSTIDKTRASLNKLPRHMARLSSLPFRAILFTPRICCQSRMLPSTLNLATLLRENRTADINVFRESRFKYPLPSLQQRNEIGSHLSKGTMEIDVRVLEWNGWQMENTGSKRARNRILHLLYKLVYICNCMYISI